MKNRGPILIIFAASLVVSPLVIKSMTKVEDAAAPPGMLHTVGQSADACAAETIQTRTLTIGCGARVNNATPRRVVAGGAMFVPARN